MNSPDGEQLSAWFAAQSQPNDDFVARLARPLARERSRRAALRIAMTVATLLALLAAAPLIETLALLFADVVMRLIETLVASN